MGLQPSYGMRPCVLLWAHLWAACGKITVIGIPNCLNYCVIFVVYTQFQSVVVGLRNTIWWVESRSQSAVWSVTKLATR